MKDVYTVFYKEIYGGILCTSNEFGIKDHFIRGDGAKCLYDELMILLSSKLVFDPTTPQKLRAPYEEEVTEIELQDNCGYYCIRICAERVDMESLALRKHQ